MIVKPVHEALLGLPQRCTHRGAHVVATHGNRDVDQNTQVKSPSAEQVLRRYAIAACPNILWLVPNQFLMSLQNV